MGGDVDEVVKFDAELRQIKSMADGTYNVILNVPEYDLDKVKQMMTWIRDLVGVAVVKLASDKE